MPRQIGSGPYGVRKLPNGKSNPEYNRRWYQAHKDRVKLLNKEWVNGNKEKSREIKRNWNYRNHVQYLKIKKDYYDKHKQEWVENHRNWRARNHERERLTVLANYHYNPEKAILRIHARKRRLPTNTIFGVKLQGFELHHMSPEVAVWIPRGMHKSISHSLVTGKNMERINFLARAWIP